MSFLIKGDNMLKGLLHHIPEETWDTSVPCDSACHLFHAGFLLALFFNPEDGSYIFLRNVGYLSTDYMALYSKGHNSFFITAFPYKTGMKCWKHYFTTCSRENTERLCSNFDGVKRAWNRGRVVSTLWVSGAVGGGVIEEIEKKY
jgi:hypothetical protein